MESCRRKVEFRGLKGVEVEADQMDPLALDIELVRGRASEDPGCTVKRVGIGGWIGEGDPASVGPEDGGGEAGFGEE